jgi:hypothetical protein
LTGERTKGLDVYTSSQVLVTTAQCQPLAFFNLSSVLRHASSGEAGRLQRDLDLHCELAAMTEHRLAMSEGKQALWLLQYMRTSKSWRVTEPLRRLDSLRRQLFRSY